MKKNANKSIAVLLCWYGKFPWYFQYFVHSCSYNLTIDFYLITDNTEKQDFLPHNLKIINKSLNDIKIIASSILKIEVNIDYPYKLCDFKPAYGLFFSKTIQNYDFWGHSDLDIIFGDIRKFITIEMLIKYDFISLRHDYATGCFAIYRNCEKMNTFFIRSKDYKKVFCSSIHYCFDECNFRWSELEQGRCIFDLDTDIESFTHLLKAGERNGDIKVHWDFILIEGLPGKIIYDHGKIIYKNEFEAILYHMILLKKIYKPSTFPKKIPNKFYISPSRIYHSRTSKKQLYS